MAESHTVDVDAGESVAVVHHAASTDDWLFFCHGFLSDKTGSYESRCERAVEEGYNAVRFDFRGSGESDGSFVDQHLSDRIADLECVVDHFDPDSYSLFGSSFGAKVALHAAVDDDRVDAIIGRAPVTYNRSFDEYRTLAEEQGTLVIDDAHAIDRSFFDDLDRHRFAVVASALDVPVALFHGREDDSVPLSDSLDAAEALEPAVLIQTYPSECHRFSRAAESRMRRQLFDWLALV